jgi:hypothetical protein
MFLADLCSRKPLNFLRGLRGTGGYGAGMDGDRRDRRYMHVSDKIIKKRSSPWLPSRPRNEKKNIAKMYGEKN